MADPSSSNDSRRHRFGKSLRKGLDRMKDVLHVGSDSRSSSPHPGRSPAPPATPRDPSPSPSKKTSQPTTAEADPPGLPSAVGANPAPAKPNVPAVTNTGSSTRERVGDVGRTIWGELGLGLNALEKSWEVFPPLKSAVAGVNGCLDIIKAAAENREDYDTLTSELKAMIDTFNQYSNELGAEDINDTVANITSSIEKEVERIRKKQDRGNLKRVLESAQDRDDVLQCYRSIEASFRQLHTKVGLRTLRNTNEQVEISKELRRGQSEQLEISKDFSRNQNEQHEMTLIEGMSPEEDARYNSAYSMTVKRRGCTVETRKNIQENLQEWVQSPDAAKVYWMNGMAGTGKTTIAYSLCEWLEAKKQLGASFFCSRTSASCRDVTRIVPTISCQLARFSPAFRSALYNLLKTDPGVSRLNVVDQFEKLVKTPLLEIKDTIPNGVVVVIDALDECEDNYGVRLVLATLMRFTASLPIKFFVSSRPEPTIQDKMLASNDYSPFVLRLHDIEDSIVEEDIKKYLKEALDVISPPPSVEEIEQLARQAGKLFIYAATVVRYILPDSPSANPSTRLKMMLAVASQPTNNSGSAKKYKDLDALYATILTVAFDEDLEDEETEAIRLVLWTAVCAKEPMTAETLALLLGVDKQRVWTALRPLQSVLHISESGGLVSTLHASFPDYMLARSRSRRFYCDQIHHNGLLAERCFEIMKEQLRFNICNLESSFTFDKAVPNLEERIQSSISPALSYSCRYWGEHLRPTSHSEILYNQLADLLIHRLLFWMEVLNLEQRIVEGSPILLEAQKWLLGHDSPTDLRRKLAEAENFVARFAASGCTRNTPHIYISALPLCPKSSWIYAHYWGHTTGLLDLRGTAMRRLEQSAMGTWLAGASIYAVGFSPDGTHIASGSDDWTIRVWNARTGDLVASPFGGHTDTVRSVAFSHDGTRIVSGSNDQTLRVWDARTGDLVAGPFQGHTEKVRSVAFSPDSTRIVSGSDDKTIRVWDARTGDLVAGPFLGHTDSVRSVAFSHDGTRIVSGSDDMTIRVWDVRAGDLVARPFEGHGSCVYSVAFSPDGTRIVSGSNDETIRVWDARTGDLVAGPFEGHTSSVRSVAFSPDGGRIVSGSHDCTVRVWDARTGDLVASPFERHTSSVRSVAFSSDGTRVVSGSDDRTIRVWDAHTSDLVAGPLQGHTYPVRSVAFSPDGTHIVSGSRDGTIRVWEALTGDLVAGPFEGHTSSVLSVAFSPDGTRIVSGSYDRTTRVWDASTGDLIARPFEGHAYWVMSVAFSPDGLRIVSGSGDRTIRVWDAFTGDLVAGPFEGHTSWVRSVAFSPDGTRIVSGSQDETIRVWDARTSVLVAGPFEGHTSWVMSVAFSPDGTRIVSGSYDKIIRVWDASTGDLISGPFEGHKSSVLSVAFSPDGTHIVSCSDDRTIRLWDASTGDLIARPFEGHVDSVNSVAFSRDGTRIVSGSDDRTIRVWDARTDAVAVSPQILAHTNLSIPSPSGHADGNSDQRPDSFGPSPDTQHYSSLPSSSDWQIDEDGWVTSQGNCLFWLPADIAACMPHPQNTFVIGRQGSIRVENWNLFLGKSWSKCYRS